MKIQAHRLNPSKPSVVKIMGVWFAQVQDDHGEFPDDGYMCRSGTTQQEALAKVPELIAALQRRKLVGTIRRIGRKLDRLIEQTGETQWG